MQLTDTHCHLDFPNYEDDLDAVLERARTEGVVRIIIPGTTMLKNEKAVELAAKYPEVFASIGIHPHEADRVDENTISRFKKIASVSDKVVAIGEIGLDYFKGYSDIENQKKLFRKCLEIAKELNLPIIFHNRDAGEDFLNIIKEVGLPERKGVVHCFSGNRDFLEKVLSMGLYVSFTGNITFKKASDLRDVIKHVPLEKLLLETDAPFLTPMPFRGKRNEPAYVKYLLAVYAEIYELTPQDIARITTHNANKLFHLEIEEESVITYPIRESLYLNITNECTNRCTFCTRMYSDYVKGHNLKLKNEPDAKEIISAMGDISSYDEIVFCGYGEPTTRLSIIKEVASYIKEKHGKVRLTTNGEGNLINKRIIAPELKGLVDRVSVSLNAPDAQKYDKLCQSEFGEGAYSSILDFTKECVKEGIEVEVTCLDMIGAEDVEKCREISESLGAKFRLRHLDVVG